MEVKKTFLSKVMPEDANGKPGEVTFALGNGVVVVAKVSEYNEETRERLMLHGLSQKIGDAAAGFSKARDFHGAFAAMQQVEDNLRAGLWASRGGNGGSDLIAALCKINGCDEETARTAVDSASEEQYKALLAHPIVKKEIAAIKAARAKEVAKTADKADLTEMFASLMK